VKPILNNKQRDNRLKFAISRIDLQSLTEDVEDVDKDWQYKGMFDEVHVDEKWFDETFESRKIVLAKDEDLPNRKT
jgi:hypothetical protein